MCALPADAKIVTGSNQHAAAENLTEEEIFKKIKSMSPKLICIVVYGQNVNAGTTNMSGAVNLINYLKDNKIGKSISLIGSHAQALPKETLEKEKNIDFIKVREDKSGLNIKTVLNILAVKYEINNLLIELNSKEPPVMDGSSKDFVSSLKEGQIVEQNAPVDFLEITKPVVYNDEDKDVEVLAVPYDGFKTTFTIQYDLDDLDDQYSSIQNAYTNYEKQIAPARTFCLLSEVTELAKQGLILSLIHI